MHALMIRVRLAEQEVIRHQGPCYIVGRGGTGKTTVILFKMLLREEAWLSQASPGTRRLRQVFVTKSSKLAVKVKEQFDQLQRSLQNATLDGAGILRRREENTNESARRLLLHSALFFSENADLKQFSALPLRFSELEDKDFPLFIPYDLVGVTTVLNSAKLMAFAALYAPRG
jgi:hypothetical protein